jgi:hypothetical protein
MKIATKTMLMMTAITLMLALATPGMAASSPAPAKSPAHANVAPASPEEHPQIRAALAALRDSKAHLEHAARDFGGHRVESIRAIDEAIRQLEICLKYDRD